MTEIHIPGVSIEETHSGVHSIADVSTDVAGFVGFTARGPYRAQLVTSMAEFRRIYCASRSRDYGFLHLAVAGFFANGGRKAYIARVGGRSTAPVTAATFIGDRRAKPYMRRGLAALADIDDISMLALPDVAHPRVRAQSRRAIVAAAVTQCEALRDRIVIIDPAPGDRDPGRSDPAINGISSSYACVYGPWLEVTATGGDATALPPCGHVAGLYARNDNQHGVWKAPAGLQADLHGITGLHLRLTETEVEALGDGGVNPIRDFTDTGRGIVVWGARTRSADADWQYVNVRRLVIFIEKSIERGMQWVVFEPNAEALWAKVRAAVTDFLLARWRSGALQGAKPEEAFFVRCDRTTMTLNDIDNGRLICQIGLAPIKPAEFVIIRIGMWTAK